MNATCLASFDVDPRFRFQFALPPPSLPRLSLVCGAVPPSSLPCNVKGRLFLSRPPLPSASRRVVRFVRCIATPLDKRAAGRYECLIVLNAPSPSVPLPVAPVPPLSLPFPPLERFPIQSGSGASLPPSLKQSPNHQSPNNSVHQS